MSPKILSIGELLVEVMRKRVDEGLSRPGDFTGPFPSGAPAIFIDAAARLGSQTGFTGVAGKDGFGDCIFKRLKRDGVDLSQSRQVSGWTTGIAFVAYQSSGSREFIFHLAHSAAALLNEADVDRQYFSSASWVHLCGSSLAFSEDGRKACELAARTCKSAGGKISFDPNVRPELIGLDRLREICAPILEIADLLLPSGQEAFFLTGIEEEIQACESLVARGIPLVALKQGARGSTVFSPGVSQAVQSIAVKELDPTGAGDCYDAAFVTGLCAGWELSKTARFANITGALAVARLGPMEGAPLLVQVLEKMDRS